jgi:citrate lyase beta subunit
MHTRLPDWLTAANHEFAKKYPGDSGARQPVHSVYGGAHLFKADTCRKLGGLAERVLLEYAPDGAAVANIFGVKPELGETIHARVLDKLRREPIEDFRVDFEDGYGIRPDAEEDASVDAAVAEMATGMAEGTLAPFTGIRIKTLSEELKLRAIRTLHRFLTGLLEKTGGTLPANFVVTLPKITVVEHVAALVEALSHYPKVGIELMIEMPQALMSIDVLVETSKGHCVAAHMGPHDYTSSLGITASSQHLMHPAVNFARWYMQNALAGTGISISDGPTNVLPIPPHRTPPLTDAQKAANSEVVHRAWKLHYTHVRHALHNGIYRGWDLHPAQLPARYVALYAFFLEGQDAASERLRNFMQSAAKATRVGEVFDDLATGQGLLNYFLKAMSCGAIPESEVPALTGLTLEQVKSASFASILKRL